MTGSANRQILLVEKPIGKLGPEHFKMVEAAMPDPKDGEALLRVRYISLDAANRAWMHGATYRSAVEANSVMAGGGIAEVISSKAPGLAAGDIVFGDREGVYFIPPALLKTVLDKADITHIHDEWTKKKFLTGKYKSSEIYPSPKDPALKKEYEEYLKQKLGK